MQRSTRQSKGGQRLLLQGESVLTRPSQATWSASFQGCISEQSVAFQDGHLSQGQPSVCSPGVGNLTHSPRPSPSSSCSFSSDERLVAAQPRFSLLPFPLSADASDPCIILSAPAGAVPFTLISMSQDNASLFTRYQTLVQQTDSLCQALGPVQELGPDLFLKQVAMERRHFHSF